MNRLLKYRKIIFVFLALFGILIGIAIFTKLNSSSRKYIYNNIDKLKYINTRVVLTHIIILSISILLSIIFIGTGLISLYLFYEFISIGFISTCFISLYKFNGIIYTVIYLLIFKTLLIFLLIILIYKYLKISKNIILYLKKHQINITQTIINIFIVNFIIIINDVFLLFFGKNMLNTFSFLLK